MGRSIPIVLIALLACCSTPRVTTRAPMPDVEKATRAVMKVCIPGDDRIVRCPTDAFRIFGKVCLACGNHLTKERGENEALRATGALDLEAERGKRIVAEVKLASPWRNPWLTIPVALAVGFGVGFGLGFSR